MKLQIAVALAALSIGGAALAQTPPAGAAHPAPSPEMRAARQAMRQACAADMTTLCAGKEHHELMMCMRDNAAKVSEPCKDAMTKMRAARTTTPAG